MLSVDRWDGGKAFQVGLCRKRAKICVLRRMFIGRVYVQTNVINAIKYDDRKASRL